MSRGPPFPWSRCRPRLPAPLGTNGRDDGAGSGATVASPECVASAPGSEESPAGSPPTAGCDGAPRPLPGRRRRLRRRTRTGGGRGAGGPPAARGGGGGGAAGEPGGVGGGGAGGGGGTARAHGEGGA